MSGQRPRTVEELAALPEGPELSFERHDYSDEDRRRGYITVRGNRFDVVADRNSVMVPVAPQLAPLHSERDDVVGYRDEHGVKWALGRYADGRWFRRRVG